MSASEATAAFAPTAKIGGSASVDPEALARGLLLVRASALGVIRLQLAMERRDRPIALQAVDELMRLDRQIGDLVGRFPDFSDDVAAGSHALEQQRRALTVEKFALAAGRSGPLMADGPESWIDQPPAKHETPRPAQAESRKDAYVARDRERETREMSPRLAVALAFIAIFAMAAAFFLFTETGRAVIAAPAAYEGASR